MSNTSASLIKPKFKAHHYPVKLMGCGFVLTAISDKPQFAWDAIRAAEKEIIRIENLISSWKENSETNKINNNAGIRPTAVSKELFDLISRSIKISECTNGAFDISGTLSRYYYKFDQEEHQPLRTDKLSELRELMDYRNIQLNKINSSIYLIKKGMKIGFGGIGKGYAAFKAYQIMIKMGIQSGLINASGDLMCWGKPLGTDSWKIAIPNPKNRKESLINFSIPTGSIVTSGNYENYTIINNQKYSHIIDPRSAIPVKQVKHVSVICPNPELADAMATAISVMGAKDGVELINRLPGLECLVIDKNDTVFYSSQLKFN